MMVRGLGEGGVASPPVVSLPAPRAAAPTVTSPEASPFARLLDKLGAEVARGERTVASALGASKTGADLGPAELLALQVGIYRYSEVVDLAAKLVDRVSSGVKTVIQGQ